MIHVQTSNDALMQTGVKILAYGAPGAGKTMMAATMPNPILINVEGGLLALRKENLTRVYGEGNPYITYEVPTITISKFSEIDEVYKWCVNSAEAKSYASVCIDSLSEIAEAILAEAKKSVRDPRLAYGEMLTKTEQTVRMFRDLPNKHVYMAAKLDMIVDENTGVSRYGPAMPGKQLSTHLPYFFDEMFYLGIGKDAQGQQYRFLQTNQTFRYDAKDRSGMLAPQEPPILGYVISKILGGVA